MKDDIQDDEIRILGGAERKPQPKPSDGKRKVPWWAAALLLTVLAGGLAGLCVALCMSDTAEEEVGVFEPETAAVQTHPLRGWLEEQEALCVHADTTEGVRHRYTAVKDTVVNDIPLRICFPLNTVPHLEVGYRCTRDTANAVLFFQAADVRADNGKIVGAFVLHGKPLSWGLSKRGYCAIIDGKVSVGVADNSPLFEEATERNGDFFRQYPLVDNGVLVENVLKAKFVRRGLCELEGRIVVVETETPESMHDFSQALTDIGVSNAIYLIGGDAIGWHRDKDNTGHPSGRWEPKSYRNISFIVWQ